MAKSRGAPVRTDDPRGLTQRQLRVGELVRQALSEILTRGEIRDPALHDVAITVSEARASADLRRAVCFGVPLGGRNTEAVVAALNRNAAWLSGQVARRVQLKFAPRLSFRADESFDQADRIGALLRRGDVAADLTPDQNAPPANDKDPADGA